MPRLLHHFYRLVERDAVDAVSISSVDVGIKGTGGSVGVAEEVKRQADWKLSMSPMTFPHHLARVMLLEQIYRAFQIQQGTRYHK